MADLRSHKIRLHTWLGAQGGSLISTGMEDFPAGSAAPPTPSKGLQIELYELEAENATLKGDSLRHVVEIVIGGVASVLEVRFRGVFLSLGRILSQGFISMNLFDPRRHQVDLWKVAVGIKLLGSSYLVADRMLPGVHFVPLLWWCQCFSICFLVFLSHLHEFCSQCIGFGLRLFARSPEYENIFEGLKMRQRIVHVAPTCIVVRSIVSIYRIQTMPICTKLCDWIWDAEWGFHLVETGSQL